MSKRSVFFSEKSPKRVSYGAAYCLQICKKKQLKIDFKSAVLHLYYGKLC